MKIESYDTLNDYWEDLDREFSGVRSEPVPGKRTQRQLRAATRAGDLSVRLALKKGKNSIFRASSLKLSRSVDKARHDANQVTRLDVWYYYGLDAQDDRYRGHLLLPGEKSGLHIENITEIPERTRTLVDIGVLLLEEKYQIVKNNLI